MKWTVSTALALALAATILRPTPAEAGRPEKGPPADRPRTVALFLDCSSSMTGKPAEHMKAGARLFCAMLPEQHRVVVIPFSSAAQPSGEFVLSRAGERDRVLKLIEGLPVSGGTAYLKALESVTLPPDSVAVFLSDGAPTEKPGAILDYFDVGKPGHYKGGPIHTIAVHAGGEAGQLLAQMAALTDGSHVAIEKSEDVVQTFLRLGQQLGSFRTFKPADEVVTLRGVQAPSRILAFGFDARADVGAGAPVTAEHQAELPGGTVHLAVVDVAATGDVTIRAADKKNDRAHLAAIVRNDLARADVQLSVRGKVALGSEVELLLRFDDRAGKALDPAVRKDLRAEAVVIQDGKESAKVRFTPAPDKRLSGLLRMPAKAGSALIRVTTWDADFEGVHERTVLLEQPRRLTAEPAAVRTSAREGTVQASLRLRVSDFDRNPASASVRLVKELPELRVVKSRLDGGTLEVEFTAKAGQHRGELVVQAQHPDVAIEPLTVPLDLDIRPLLRGPRLPKEFDLGSVAANDGTRKLSAIEIATPDLDAAEYQVIVSDLSNGTTLIPLSTTQRSLSPTHGRPARVGLTADLGNVPAGTYGGYVELKLLGAEEGKRFRSALRLTITEPVSSDGLDFGAVEPGRVYKRKLVVRNSSVRPVSDLKLTAPTFAVKGGRIAMKLPERIDTVPSGKSVTVDVTLEVFPDVSTRGTQQAAVRVGRAAGRDVEWPVRFKLVDVGAAGDDNPSDLVVTPGEVKATVAPGGVVRVEVSVKLVVGAAGEVTLEADADRLSDGTRSGGQFSWTWPDRQKLSPGGSVRLRGDVLAPETPGTFTTTLVIRAGAAGVRKVPVVLEVK